MSVSTFGGRRRMGGEVRCFQEAQGSTLSPQINGVLSQAIAFLGPPPPKSIGSIFLLASTSASVKRGADRGGALWHDTRVCVAPCPLAAVRTSADSGQSCSRERPPGAGQRGHAEQHHVLGGDRVVKTLTAGVARWVLNSSPTARWLR